MPSNACKISQLIAALQAEQMAHGDLDCVMVSQGEPIALDGSNMLPVMELPSGRLNAPVLAFGVTLDNGVQTNMPGQRYQVSGGDASGWNYSRSEAPVDTIVRVWRRFGGEDRGKRTDDGRWFVFNGGDFLVECVPQGILGWKADEA